MKILARAGTLRLLVVGIKEVLLCENPTLAQLRLNSTNAFPVFDIWLFVDDFSALVYVFNLFFLHLEVFLLSHHFVVAVRVGYLPLLQVI